MAPDVALLRAWRRRLRASGFDDVELPDGTLRGPRKPPGRWRSFESASPLEREATAAYFHRATTFCASHRFRKLKPLHRAAWRLHSKGLSNAEVAKALRVSLKKVRVALASGRLLAGLPEVTSTLGHGRQETPHD